VLQQLDAQRVQGEKHGPNRRSETQDAARADAELQGREDDEGPEGLGEACDAEEEGDLERGEAEAAERGGGEPEDGGDCCVCEGDEHDGGVDGEDDGDARGAKDLERGEGGVFGGGCGFGVESLGGGSVREMWESETGKVERTSLTNKAVMTAEMRPSAPTTTVDNA